MQFNLWFQLHPKRIHRIELWLVYIHNKSIDRILRVPYVTNGLVGPIRHQFIKNYHKYRLWLLPSWWFVRYIQLMYKNTKQFYSIKTAYPRLNFIYKWFFLCETYINSTLFCWGDNEEMSILWISGEKKVRYCSVVGCKSNEDSTNFFFITM